MQFGRVRAQEEAKRAGRGEEAQRGDAIWTSVTARGIIGVLTYRERDGRRADHEAKHDVRWELFLSFSDGGRRREQSSGRETSASSSLRRRRENVTV